MCVFGLDLQCDNNVLTYSPGRPRKPSYRCMKGNKGEQMTQWSVMMKEKYRPAWKQCQALSWNYNYPRSKVPQNKVLSHWLTIRASLASAQTKALK